MATWPETPPFTEIGLGAHLARWTVTGTMTGLRQHIPQHLPLLKEVVFSVVSAWRHGNEETRHSA